MSRLTHYDSKQKQYIRLASRLAVDNKLGKLEDLIQSYNVKDLEELDKLLGMATAYEELSKQLGCPLDTIFKIMNQGYVYTDTFNNQLKKFKFDKVFKLTNINNEYILCFLFREIEDEDNNTLGINWIVGVNEYKKSFWLKEDKSE